MLSHGVMPLASHFDGTRESGNGRIAEETVNTMSPTGSVVTGFCVHSGRDIPTVFPMTSPMARQQITSLRQVEQGHWLIWPVRCDHTQRPRNFLDGNIGWLFDQITSTGNTSTVIDHGRCYFEMDDKKRYHQKMNLDEDKTKQISFVQCSPSRELYERISYPRSLTTLPAFSLHCTSVGLFSCPVHAFPPPSYSGRHRNISSNRISSFDISSIFSHRKNCPDHKDNIDGHSEFTSHIAVLCTSRVVLYRMGHSICQYGGIDKGTGGERYKTLDLSMIPLQWKRTDALLCQHVPPITQPRQPNWSALSNESSWLNPLYDYYEGVTKNAETFNLIWKIDPPLMSHQWMCYERNSILIARFLDRASAVVHTCCVCGVSHVERRLICRDVLPLFYTDSTCGDTTSPFYKTRLQQVYKQPSAGDCSQRSRASVLSLVRNPKIYPLNRSSN